MTLEIVVEWMLSGGDLILEKDTIRRHLQIQIILKKRYINMGLLFKRIRWMFRLERILPKKYLVMNHTMLMRMVRLICGKLNMILSRECRSIEIVNLGGHLIIDILFWID